jgi:single-strand DNA-binding protein
MSLNCINLVGRAGRDPELRFFESGSAVANLSLAVDKPSRNRDEKPDWFNLEIWGKQAQVAADYVRKGSLIGVVGRMTSEQWTDRNTGEQRSKPVVKVERLVLLSSKTDNAAAGQSSGASGPDVDKVATPPTSTTRPQGWSGTPISDEQVPF